MGNEKAIQAWLDAGRRLEQTNPPEAEQAYRHALAEYPAEPELWFRLGVVLLSAEREVEARQALDQIELQCAAKAKNPEWVRQANYLLAMIHRLSGRHADAIDVLQSQLESNPHDRHSWELLGRCLVESAQLPAAIEHYQGWLQQIPADPLAEHLLAAIHGDVVPSRAAPAYVADSSDHLAPLYDACMAYSHYHGPELFRRLLQVSLPSQSPDPWRVLDAGCGTGLLGGNLRGFAQSLIGVDLSPRMLELAQRRDCYDELCCSDLLEHLQQATASYDLIVAADSLCYFGELSEVIPLCFQALKPNGYFAFSVEQGPLSEDNYFLQPSGRYMHAPPYIMMQLGELGITGGTMRRVVTRKENGRDVYALLVCVQQPSQ